MLDAEAEKEYNPGRMGFHPPQIFRYSLLTNSKTMPTSRSIRALKRMVATSGAFLGLSFFCPIAFCPLSPDSDVIIVYG